MVLKPEKIKYTSDPKKACMYSPSCSFFETVVPTATCTYALSCKAQDLGQTLQLATRLVKPSVEPGWRSICICMLAGLGTCIGLDVLSRISHVF